LYSYNDCVAEYDDPIILTSTYSSRGIVYSGVSTYNRIVVLGFDREDSSEVERRMVSYEFNRDKPGIVEVQQISDSTRVLCRPTLGEVIRDKGAEIDSLKRRIATLDLINGIVIETGNNLINVCEIVQAENDSLRNLLAAQKAYIDGTFSMGQSMATEYFETQAENDSLKTLLEMRESMIAALIDTGSATLIKNKYLEAQVDSMKQKISTLERAIVILPYHNGVLYISRDLVEDNPFFLKDFIIEGKSRYMQGDSPWDAHTEADSFARQRWSWPSWSE